MTIEQRPADRVIPYARNARKIPERAVDKVAASLKEFSWRQPIVVDAEGVIVVAHLMVTDPPYGVEYDPKWRLDAGINKPWQKRAEGKVSNDDRADWRETWSLFPGDVAYVWHGALHAALRCREP